MIYFGAGRLLYFGAPIFVGWMLSLIAARQRLRSAWPVIAGVLLAGLGATAQVHSSRATDAVEQIRMTFSLGSSSPEIWSTVFRALVIAGLALMPYSIWRLATRRRMSA